MRKIGAWIAGVWRAMLAGIRKKETLEDFLWRQW